MWINAGARLNPHDSRYYCLHLLSLIYIFIIIEGLLSGVMTKPLLRVLQGETLSTPPVWFMRQAGRYLPEYRELRATAGDFMKLCFNPTHAAEVTLQPIRRFGFDCAILFSDILVVPYALGQDLWFEQGEGPRLAPALVDQSHSTLQSKPERLAPIYETVQRVRAALSGTETTLIGFCGSPWTVATYMIAGQGSKDHAAARLMAYRTPELFQQLIEMIITTSISYLRGQADAGAEALMLFDSWAGILPPDQFDKWVVGPNAAIARALKQSHPQILLIGFPRGGASRAAQFLGSVPVEAIAVEETADLEMLKRDVPATIAIQGNLDPMLLQAGGDQLGTEIRRIKAALKGRPHIFNLGHGISQFTPIAHVEQALRIIREPS
jgi:uroporphyrinogen decarboxylase